MFIIIIIIIIIIKFILAY